MVSNWIRNIQFWLYPPRCLLCGAPGEGGLDLCGPCRAALPWLGPHCPVCAVPLPEGADGPCGTCLAADPPYTRILAPLYYRPPVDWLIPRLKFQGRLSHARLLGSLMAEYLAARLGDPPDLILPVPLHPTRLRERGFNQARELAVPVARRLGLPLGRGLVRRVKATRAQMELSARQRRANVRGAFAVTGPVEGLRIALVDDVATTGATLGALAQALRRAGAREVQCWVAARAGGG